MRIPVTMVTTMNSNVYQFHTTVYQYVCECSWEFLLPWWLQWTVTCTSAMLLRINMSVCVHDNSCYHGDHNEQ